MKIRQPGYVNDAVGSTGKDLTGKRSRRNCPRLTKRKVESKISNPSFMILCFGFYQVEDPSANARCYVATPAVRFHNVTHIFISFY